MDTETKKELESLDRKLAIFAEAVRVVHRGLKCHREILLQIEAGAREIPDVDDIQ